MSAADVYLEKLAAVRAADQEASRAVARLIKTVREFGSEGNNWRAMAKPEKQQRPMSEAVEARAYPVPTWQTSQEIKNYIVAYQDALLAVRQAYNALTPIQQAGVQPPPSEQE